MKGRGILIQKLEYLAIALEAGSAYRTDALTNETPEWPDPDPIPNPIKCKRREAVLHRMFMRDGKRDPLDCHVPRARRLQ